MLNHFYNVVIWGLIIFVISAVCLLVFAFVADTTLQCNERSAYLSGLTTISAVEGCFQTNRCSVTATEFRKYEIAKRDVESCRLILKQLD